MGGDLGGQVIQAGHAGERAVQIGVDGGVAGIAVEAVGDVVYAHGGGVVQVVRQIADDGGGQHAALIGIDAVHIVGAVVLIDDLHLLAVQAGHVQVGGQVIDGNGVGGDLAAVEGVVGQLVGVLVPVLVVVGAGDVAVLHHRVEAGLQEGVAVRILGEGIALGDLAGGHVLAPGADHQSGLDGVVGHLGGVVAGDGLRHAHVAQLVIQAGLVGVAVGVGLPVVAHQAEHIGVVADGGQEHLGGLAGGQGAAGIEVAGAVAVDDAHAGAVLDVRLGPVVINVGVGGDHLGADVGLHAAVHHEGDDLGHLGTGQGASGVVVAAVFLTVDDIQCHHGVDGLSVLDLIRVGEIGGARSAGGDDHHADQHGGGHYQTESPLEVSHRKFLLLKICPREEEETSPLRPRGLKEAKQGKISSKDKNCAAYAAQFPLNNTKMGEEKGGCGRREG